MESCGYSCSDVTLVKHFIQIDPKYFSTIKIVMISEALPINLTDYFDGGEKSKFILNTNIVFGKLDYKFCTFEDYLKNGIYLTTAIKCVKNDYLVSSKTIENCSTMLEKELNQFPNVKLIMLMGDFAIKAINHIWKRKHGIKAIPSGSTYKIRNETFESNGVRFLPSYTQTGESFGIEKVKVEMILEDVAKGMEIIGKSK